MSDSTKIRYWYVDLKKLKEYLQGVDAPELRAFVIDLCRDVLMHKVGGSQDQDLSNTAVFRRQQVIESLQHTGVIVPKESDNRP